MTSSNGRNSANVNTAAFDPYVVLGLEKQAAEGEIKRAYFLLVREHPPEKDPEKFQEIRRAYEQLREPERRALVDLFLLQPPPALPNRRRPAYDLSVHAEDILTLAMELAATPIEDDYRDIS